jgi:hypothetical protein
MLIVGEIYRIPGSNNQVSVERFDSLLHSLTNFKEQIVIGTDQNFNFVNVQHHNKTLELLNVFIASGLFPTIPTRIALDTSSLIDNIYVKLSDKHEVSSSGVVTTDISDHLPIFNFIGRQPAQKPENKFVKYRKLNNNAIQRIISFLDSIDWINILKDLNVDDASNYFMEKITDAFDTFAPEKTIKIKPENIICQPWMTPGLLALSRTKDKMYRKCIGVNNVQAIWIL